MSHIEQVWTLAGRRLARDPRPAASKDERWLRIQAIWTSVPQADIQTLFDSMPRCIAALIAARVVATPNTDFGLLILFFLL
ncbi:transposable element Tcb2 transposase [Trichonephila clavipes]|nr:transposable element Tcb2 transposase [Trichonephila clavipes]